MVLVGIPADYSRATEKDNTSSSIDMQAYYNFQEEIGKLSSVSELGDIQIPNEMSSEQSLSVPETSLNKTNEYEKFILKRLIVSEDESFNTYGAYKDISGYLDYHILCYNSIEETLCAYNSLLDDGINVAPDEIVKTASVEECETNNVSAQTTYNYSSWGGDAMEIDGYRDYLESSGSNSNQVVVAVLDTGINTAHNAFIDRFLYDENGKIVGDSYCDTTYTYSGYRFEDDDGHGTHVSGIICDLTSNNVKILPMRVLGTDGSGYSTDIIAALAKVDVEYSAKYNIACVNMSLGGGASASTYVTYVDTMFSLKSKGVLTVVAAGNASTDCSDTLPAASEPAITVSALKRDEGELLFDDSYSNYGDPVDVAAPGSSIESAYIASSAGECPAVSATASLSGTSMATPHVSGAVALLCSDIMYWVDGVPQYSASTIESVLKANALDLGVCGKDINYGYGAVNLVNYDKKKTSETLSFNLDGISLGSGRNLSAEIDLSSQLSVSCSDESYTIYYNTDDGRKLSSFSKIYSSPLTINKTQRYLFVAQKTEGGVTYYTELYLISFTDITPVSTSEYFTINRSGVITGYVGQLEKVEIPSVINGIVAKGIGPKLFENDLKIKSIVFPDSITEIGDKAFQGCTSLEYLYGPAVTFIGSYSFQNCDSIPFINSDAPGENTAGFYLPKLTQLQPAAFRKCDGIQTVELPLATSVPASVFAHCSALVSCELPAVSSIYTDSFGYCDNLKTLTFGDSLQIYKNQAVYDTPKLENITIGANNQYFYSDGRALYGKREADSSTAELVLYYSGNSQSYTILDTVTIGGVQLDVVGTGMTPFRLVNIDELTIPAGLSEIGPQMFYEPQITTLYYNVKNANKEACWDEDEKRYWCPFSFVSAGRLVIGSGVESIPEGYFVDLTAYTIEIQSLNTELNLNSFDLSGKIRSEIFINVSKDSQIDDVYYTKLFNASQVSYIQQFKSTIPLDKLSNYASVFTNVYSDGTYYYYARSDGYVSPKYYSIIVNSNVIGAYGLESSTYSIASGSSKKLSFVLKPGYYISAFVVNGVAQSSNSIDTIIRQGYYKFSNVTSDQTLDITFVKKDYIITTYYSPEEYGNVYLFRDEKSYFDRTISFNEGDRATYVFEVEEFGVIDTVIIDGNEVSADVLNNIRTSHQYEFVNINANHEMIVYFSSKEMGREIYQITVINGSKDVSHGSISPASIGVEKGDSQEFTFTPGDNCYLEYVKLDGVLIDFDELSKGSGEIYSYTINNVTSDHTLEVGFAKYQTIQIFTYALPEGASDVSSAKQLEEFLYRYKYDEIVKDFIPQYEGMDLCFGYVWNRSDSVREDYVEIPLEQIEEINNSFSVKVDLSFKLYYEEKPFEINISSSTGVGITPYGNNPVSSGSSLTLTINVGDGYEISYIEIDNHKLTLEEIEEIINNSYQYTFDNVYDDHSFYVEFKKKTYTITSGVIGNSGSISPDGNNEFEHGDNVTYTFTPNTGYKIKSITVDNNVLEGTYLQDVVNSKTYTFTNVTSAHSIYVEFEIKTYVITSSVSRGEGTINPLGNTTVVYGGSQKYTFEPSEGFEINTITVNGVDLAGTVLSQAIENGYYIFENITSDSNSISVTFSRLTFTIRVSIDGVGRVNPSDPQVVEYGGNSPIYRFEPEIGYEVRLIKIGDDELEGQELIDAVENGLQLQDIKQNYSITAVFRKIDEYTISSSVNSATYGSITPSGVVSVQRGGEKSYTIKINEAKYYIARIEIDKGLATAREITDEAEISEILENGYTFSNITSNHSIYIVFAIKQFKITVDCVGGGTISPIGSSKVDYGGSSLKYTFSPDINYKVGVIKVDGEPLVGNALSNAITNGYQFVNVQSDHKIEVEFVLKTAYNIKATAGNGGSISPSGQSQVYEGGSLVYTIKTNTGYYVSAFSVDGTSLVGQLASYQVADGVYEYVFDNVLSNHAIDVQFAKYTYEIVIYIGENGSLWESDDDYVTTTVEYGDDITYEFKPNVGYEIGQVIINGARLSQTSPSIYSDMVENNKYTFNSVTSNQIMSVEFVIKTYSVTVLVSGNANVYISNNNYLKTISETITHGQASSLFKLQTTSEYAVLRKVTINNDEYTNDTNSEFITNILTSGYQIDSVTEDYVIQINFVEREKYVFLITASCGSNGGISPNGEVYVTEKESQTFKITPANGHYIASVIIDRGLATETEITDINELTQIFENGYIFDSVESHHSIHVTFAIKTFAITLTVVGDNGHIEKSGSNDELITISETVNYGQSSSTYWFVPNQDYQLAQVMRNNVPYDTTSIQEFRDIGFILRGVSTNYTIYIFFGEKPKYKITTTVGAGGTISPMNPMVTEGASQTFTFSPYEGYAVSSIKIDGKALTGDALSNAKNSLSYTFTNVVKKRNIEVMFYPLSYTVQVQIGMNGTVEYDGETIVGGSTLSLIMLHGSNVLPIKMVPNKYYEVSSIILNGAGLVGDELISSINEGLTIKNVISNQTVIVQFVRKQVEISSSASAGGIVNPLGETLINMGEDITFNIVANNGYMIDTILIDGEPIEVDYVEQQYTFNCVEEAHTIDATFKPREYKFKLETNGHGDIVSLDTDDVITHGETIVFTFIAHDACWLEKLIIDDVEYSDELDVFVENGYTFAYIDAEHSITAVFGRTEYFIQVEVDGQGTAVIKGGNKIGHGETLVLVLTPMAGYEVESVMVGEDVLNIIDNTVTIENITSEFVIKVKFKQLPKTIEVFDVSIPNNTLKIVAICAGVCVAFIVLGVIIRKAIKSRFM